MAFSDVINNYTQGETGVLTDGDGRSVTYTVTDGANTFNKTNHGNFSAQIQSQGQDTVVVTFDEPVVGAAIAIFGSDSDEFYGILVDGQLVDLNDLIADGDATFANVGTVASHTINPDGSISGGTHTDGSVGTLVFNIPVTSLGATGVGGVNGEFQADGIEIGIDSVAFSVVCFTAGTLISTSTGLTPVEHLSVGDQLRTIDNVHKPIRWIGSRNFDGAVLQHHDNLLPVRITAGALGPGMPKRDLCVSRQHRILVSSRVVKNMFGVSEVLIPAIKLTALPGIYVDKTYAEVTYYHVLLDEHEVIFAQGIAAETLYLGSHGLAAMTPETRDEIFAIFPELAHDNHTQDLARPVPAGQKQKQLVKRHIKTNRSLVENASP